MLQLIWRNLLRSFYQFYCVSSSLACMVIQFSRLGCLPVKAPEPRKCVGTGWGARQAPALAAPVDQRRLGSKDCALQAACSGLPDSLLLCPFPATWELESSFELVLMHSLFCLAELSCLIPANTVTEFSGERLASEVASRRFMGVSSL